MSAVIDIALNTPELWNALFIGLAALVVALKTGKLSKELKPNGGASLRDAVDRIEKRLDQHDEVHADLIERLERIAER